jgi:hypothetical protein
MNKFAMRQDQYGEQEIQNSSRKRRESGHIRRNRSSLREHLSASRSDPQNDVKLMSEYIRILSGKGGPRRLLAHPKSDGKDNARSSGYVPERTSNES